MENMKKQLNAAKLRETFLCSNAKIHQKHLDEAKHRESNLDAQMKENELHLKQEFQCFSTYRRKILDQIERTQKSKDCRLWL